MYKPRADFGNERGNEARSFAVVTAIGPLAVGASVRLEKRKTDHETTQRDASILVKLTEDHTWKRQGQVTFQGESQRPQLGGWL